MVVPSKQSFDFHLSSCSRKGIGAGLQVWGALHCFQLWPCSYYGPHLSVSRAGRTGRSHHTQAHFPLSHSQIKAVKTDAPILARFPIWFLSLSFLPWGPRCPSGTGWEFPCCAPWWKLPQGLVGSRRSLLLLWRVLPTFCALSPSPRLLDEDQGTFSRNRKVSLKRCRIS